MEHVAREEMHWAAAHTHTLKSEVQEKSLESVVERYNNIRVFSLRNNVKVSFKGIIRWLKEW